MGIDIASGGHAVEFGNLNSKKGNKQINTMAILKQPNKIGGTDMFIPSFPVG